MKKLHLIIPLLLFVSVVFGQKKIKVDPSIVFNDDISSGFFILGDWGRKGEDKQKELANAMGAVARVHKPEFIISTGDNFYPNGVASVHDPQWHSSFEDVYSDFSLNIDWYVVLGNHDYRGNIQAEIDYTNISRRWNMPDKYYSFERELEDGSKALFVFTDTNPLNDAYYQEQKYQKMVSQQDTSAQIIWLKETLSASDADWKVVTGHHPLYTGGKRIGKKNHVRPHLEYILKKYDVDFYFAGHEHDLQYIKPEGPTHHIVSGAGSEVRPTNYLPITLYAKARQGFAFLTLEKRKAVVYFIDYKGKVLYKKEVSK